MEAAAHTRREPIFIADDGGWSLEDFVVGDHYRVNYLFLSTTINLMLPIDVFTGIFEEYSDSCWVNT